MSLTARPGGTAPAEYPEADVVRLAIVGDASSPNVLRWADGLAAAGAEVAIASFERPPPSWTGEVLPLRATRPGRQRYVAAVPAARRVLRRWRPDITAGYFVTGYGLLAALSAPGPLVQVGVGSDLLTTDAGSVLGRIVRFSLRRADLVVVWSEELAAAAVRLGASADRLFVQPRGIPVDEFAAVQPATDGLSVVSTRSLRPLYRIDVLIDAMAHLPTDAHLTIVGDGPCRAGLEEQAVVLGMADRITFAGAVPNHAIPGHLAGHSVFVSLSPRDGVSASLLEAMASGLVPVAVDNAANRAWVQGGSTGVLLEAVTPRSVAAAILEAARPEVRAAAVPANRDLVRRHADLYANAATMLDRLRALSGHRDGAPPEPAPSGQAPMRIVFVVRQLAMGGAERQLVQLALGLSERGHRAEVAVLRPGGALEEVLRQRRVAVHDLSAAGDGLLARFRSLVSLARGGGVDVLHGYLPGQNLLAALVRPFAPSLCIVWGVRASRFAVSGYHNRRARVSYRAEPLLAPLVDLVITNSNAARAGDNARRYPRRKTVTIPNGIDADHFRPDPLAAGAARAALGVPAGVPLILVVGQLDPVKGHDVLLDAIGLLRPHHPEWRYLVVGRGPEDHSRRLLQQALALGVADQIVWRPHEPDLRPLYAAADVLCLPSRAEGFPNVVGEAMATGTPVVATAVGDVREIVGETGIVVPPEDAEALARGIAAAVGLPTAAGERARARIQERYSVPALVERTEAALARAVALRRAG